MTLVDFSRLVTVHEKTIPRETILFTPKTRAWCTLRYPGHPRGCPNNGKNEGCPPRCSYNPGIIDRYTTFTLVYAVFDFVTYKEIRRQQHPGWTEAQVKNVLYWQNSVKKLLKEYIERRGGYDDVLGSGSGFWGKPSMEADGIYVFGTLKKNGIPFEVKPVNTVLMVSLLMSGRTRGWRMTIGSDVELVEIKETTQSAIDAFVKHHRNHARSPTPVIMERHS